MVEYIICVLCLGFCEKLFRQLDSTTERFEVKLLMVDLVSRLIGIHQVNILIGLCKMIAFFTYRLLFVISGGHFQGHLILCTLYTCFSNCN